MSEAAIDAPPSPYKGLASFGESDLDALLFFGREREIEVISANLVAARLTILYGPSGVGKTSLLRAGVAQRMRREGGTVVLLSSWSGDPSTALRAALEVPSAIPGTLYVVLDQFEEFFLYHDDAGPLADLADAVRGDDVRANLLISIREDALAQLDAFKARIPNLFANSLRLDRLDRAAAKRAILGPLERYNGLIAGSDPVGIEDAAVEEILDSVTVGRIQLGTAGRGGTDELAADAGRLEAPYLQLVLERLWDVERERNSRQLRVATLRELGGAQRIVEEHLERAMADLSVEEKDTAAAMYNHLVTPSGTKIAHRASDLARYAAVDEERAAHVLDRLARERIVRAAEDGAAGPQYEIFHDVLADAVLGWRARYETDRQLEEERREAARRNRRLALLAGASLVAVAVLAGITLYALSQRSAARESEREARAGELVARAAASLPDDPARSLSLAVAASRITRSQAVEDMLRRGLAGLRAQAVIPVTPPGEMALGPDGSSVAVASGGTVRVYSDGGTRLARTLRHPRVVSASFSSDGSRLVTVGNDGTARIWGANGRLLRTLTHPGPVESASFSKDGRRALTVAERRVVRVFDARTGRPIVRFDQPSNVLAARFSPDGRLIATGGSDKLARLWDARTGKLRIVLEGHVGPVGDVAFSADGELLATGSTDGTARVWQTADGARVTTLPGHENYVSRVEFSPDATLVATGSRDRRARIFDAQSSTLKAVLAGHRDAITDLAWAADGATLTTAGADGVIRRWDAAPQPVLALVRRQGSPVAAVAFSADGRRIMAVAAGHGRRSEDPRLQANGRLREAVRQFGRPTDVAFTEEGTLAVSGYGDGSARLWDAETAEPVRELPRHNAAVTSATFSPDGESVVTTSMDHVARLSDVRTGKQVWARSHTAAVGDAAFSSDGRWVVIAGPGYAGVVERSTGERILLLNGRDRRLTAAAFSPTGWRIATGGQSGAVRTYDCRLCGNVDDLVKLAEERLAPLRVTE